ncbi:MAG: sugar transferase [Desulfarculus sp.]|nr:sugar transferase [Desulfarculus sp.]
MPQEPTPQPPATLAPMPLPWLKRAFDLVFAGGLLLLSAPVFVLAFVGIILEHLLRGQARAPLFYTEPRVSQGRPFAFRKFNIFRPGVIEAMRQNGQFIHTKTLEHDGQSLSLVGTILQRAYLDELPQLLSILLGDMSVVGPRPRNLEIYEQGLARGEHFRTVLKAGLTGMVQAHKDLPGLNMDKQASMDQEYLDFQMQHGPWRLFLLDMKLIRRTVTLMAKAKGL